MNYGYAGTRELNEALSSRFAILSVPEISETDLDRLIKRSFPDINPKICTQFVKLFVELMRKTEKAEISDRDRFICALTGVVSASSTRLIWQKTNRWQFFTARWISDGQSMCRAMISFG
jgi:hypothetical protein